ncbi:hypothetical protein [Streptomyces sp. AK02-01A]|nr:hypothetical protein [Streptomyces sp. AK02-01A]
MTLSGGREVRTEFRVSDPHTRRFTSKLMAALGPVARSRSWR